MHTTIDDKIQTNFFSCSGKQNPLKSEANDRRFSITANQVHPEDSWFWVFQNPISMDCKSCSARNSERCQDCALAVALDNKSISEVEDDM